MACRLPSVAIDAVAGYHDPAEVLEQIAHLPSVTALRLAARPGPDSKWPEALGRLEWLRRADLYGTFDMGRLSEAHLRNLRSLEHLDVLLLGPGAAGWLGNLRAAPNLRQVSFHKPPGDAELATLRELRIAGLGVHSQHFDDAGLENLATDLPGLEVLDLWGSDVTARGLACLTKMRGLRELRLDWNRLSDQELAAIGHLRWLETLSVTAHYISPPDKAFISGQGVRSLSRMDSLRRLSLAVKGGPMVEHVGPAFTADDLASLQACTALEVLSLPWGIVGDDNIHGLSGLRNLRQLDLPYSEVSDAGLVSLRGLAKIETVDLSFTKVAMAQPSPWRHVRVLDLRWTPVTDASAANIAAMAELEELRLDHTTLGNTGLGELAQLRALRSLSLASTQVSDTGLSHLARLASLEELDLSATDIGDEGVLHLAKLSKLRVLQLSCTKVTDKGVAVLAGLPNLEYLGLERCALTEACIPDLTRMKGLMFVDLRRTSLALNISDVDGIAP